MGNWKDSLDSIYLRYLSSFVRSSQCNKHYSMNRGIEVLRQNNSQLCNKFNTRASRRIVHQTKQKAKKHTLCTKHSSSNFHSFCYCLVLLLLLLLLCMKSNKNIFLISDTNHINLQWTNKQEKNRKKNLFHCQIVKPLISRNCNRKTLHTIELAIERKNCIQKLN